MSQSQQFGQRVRRNEDPRLLTGQALFVDDVDLPGMGHAAFVRSPHAHARIVSIDTSAAAEMPGVIAVFTAESLGAHWQPGPLLVSPPPIKDIVFNQRTQVPLAKDKVRFAGEPVVMVVAESRYLAEDAVDAIWVEYEPLPAVVDLEAAIRPDTPLVHEDVPLAPGVGANVNAHVVQIKGDGAQFDAIARRAALVLKRRFYYDHGTAAAMENRGIVAAWDRRAGRLTIWDTTQAPISIRNWHGRLSGPLGKPGAGHRPVHRRRLRPQDHDVLPGRGNRALGQCNWGDRSNGSKIAARTLWPPRRSATRSIGPRWRWIKTAASWPCATNFPRCREPTRPTA
jgi:CO/xanthine dehydrogenase Mo-binding subunit